MRGLQAPHDGRPARDFTNEHNVSKRLSSIEAAVDALRRGEVVIAMDAEDRENEGDFICAAEKVTPAIINFMLNGRGQLCMPLLPELSHRLDLHPMVEDNTAPLRHEFHGARRSYQRGRA